MIAPLYNALTTPDELRRIIDRLRTENAHLRDLAIGANSALHRVVLDNERLRAVLESLTEDPPATLDEPDANWEVIVKMRAIAREALTGREE